LQADLHAASVDVTDARIWRSQISKS